MAGRGLYLLWGIPPDVFAEKAMGWTGANAAPLRAIRPSRRGFRISATMIGKRLCRRAGRRSRVTGGDGGTKEQTICHRFLRPFGNLNVRHGVTKVCCAGKRRGTGKDGDTVRNLIRFVILRLSGSPNVRHGVTKVCQGGQGTRRTKKDGRTVQFRFALSLPLSRRRESLFSCADFASML